MFGFFKKKKAEKIDLQQVVREMSMRLWDVELHENKENTIVVHGKYRNYQSDFQRLLIQFLGNGEIRFLDERGRGVTHIPSRVQQKDMYIHMKDILNVL